MRTRHWEQLAWSSGGQDSEDPGFRQGLCGLMTKDDGNGDVLEARVDSRWTASNRAPAPSAQCCINPLSLRTILEIGRVGQSLSRSSSASVGWQTELKISEGGAESFCTCLLWSDCFPKLSALAYFSGSKSPAGCGLRSLRSLSWRRRLPPGRWVLEGGTG